MGHKRCEALGEEKHILNRDAILFPLIAKLGRLACISQKVFAEGGLLPAIAGQRQTGRNGHAALTGYTTGLDLFGDGGQRQQEVVVVGGLVPLDRLPSAATNKKTPAERKRVLTGVRFAVTEGRDAGREGTVSCFDGVVAVVDADDHGKPRFPYMR